MSFHYNGSKTNLNEFLFTNREYYDIVLETIDKKIINAHKIILASKMQYFNNLFKFDKLNKYQVNTTYVSMNEIIRYAYCNSYEFSNIDDFMECLLYCDQIVYNELFDELLNSLDPELIDKKHIIPIISKLVKLNISNEKKIIDKINELSNEKQDLKENNKKIKKIGLQIKSENYRHTVLFTDTDFFI